MNGAVPDPQNVLAGVGAGVGDGVTGNFTAAGNRFAAAGDPAGAAEPVPRVSGRPQTVSGAPRWTAPQPGGGGRITVARDVLRGVAGRMRSELATLDSAVSRVRAAGAGVGSLSGWPTGDAFSGNAVNAHDGCLGASEQVADGHQAVAGNLSDSAATYDAAESDSTQAVRGVAAILDGSPATSSGAAGDAFAHGAAATPSGRAAGAVPAAGPYPVKSNDVQPFDAAGMTTAQIMSILHRLDPGAAAAAGTAHTALGRTADTMAGHLTGYAQMLAQSWTGTAARAAMARLQQLYDQTSVVAAQAAQTGSVLTWLGTDVLPAFQRLQTPGTGSALATGAAAGGVIGGTAVGAGGAMPGTAGAAAAAGLDALLTGGAAAQAQAQKYLTALSGYLVTANSALPGQIGGPAVLASAGGGGGPGPNGTDAAATGAASAGAAASGTANGPVTGRSGPADPLTSRAAAGNGGLVLGGAVGAGAALGAGRTGSAAGAGDAGSASATGDGGPAADAVAGSPSGAGGDGPAPGAAAAGPAPDAGGSALSGGGAGAPVSGTSRIASPAAVPAANSLQSAAPVPGSSPGAVPAPPPAAASASGPSGPGSLGAGGASSVPMVAGLPGSGAGAVTSGGSVATGGGNAGDGSNEGRPGEGEAGAPAAGMLPGVQDGAGARAAGVLPGVQGQAGGPAAAMLPGLPGEAGGPAAGMLPGFQGEAGAPAAGVLPGVRGGAGAPAAGMLPGVQGKAGGPAAAMLPGLPGEAGGPAAGKLPGLPGGTGAADVPEVPGLASSAPGGMASGGGIGPVGGMAPMGEAAPVGGVPGLDVGLTGGATPVPEVPGLATPSTASVPGAVPVGGATGAFALTADGPGAPGAGDSPGRGVVGGMPMAGGGTALPEQERTRRAWASEDENVWGLPSGCVPPVIEGG